MAKSWYSGHYLKRIIFAYLLILIIPTAILASTVVYTAKSYRTVVENDSELLIENLYSALDYRIYEMEQIKNNVVKSSFFVKNLGNSPAALENKYAYYQLNQYLSSFLSDVLSDLFIYYEAEDTIVSGSASTATSFIYYQTNYADSGMSYLEWLREISSPSNGSYNRFYVKNGQTLLYRCSSPYNNGIRRKEAGVYINLVMSEAKIRTLLYNSGMSRYHADVEVFDANQTLLLSARDGSEEIRTEPYDEKNYAVQTYTSGLTGFKYVMYVPTKMYRKPLKNFQATLAILFLVFLILSGIASLWLAKFTYSPVKKLTRQLIQKIPAGDGEGNEFEYINQAIDRVVEEKKVMAGKLLEESKSLVDSIFLQAFRNQEPAGFDIKAVLRKYNINICHDFCRIGVIGIENVYSEIPPDLNSIIEDGLYALQLPNILYFATKVDTNHYAVVFNCAENFEIDCSGLLIQICSFLKTGYSLESAAGLSETHGLSSMHKAYEQAEQALKYQNVFGEETVIGYQMVKNRKFNYDYNAVKQSYQKLESFILSSRNNRTAADLYEEIRTDSFKESEASLEVFQCFRYDMINTLCKIAAEHFPAADIDNGKLIEPLLESKTVSELDDAVIGSLLSMNINYHSCRKEDGLETAVIAYLNENYMNPDISNLLLGQYFHLSPSYLSKQFKEKAGIGPLVYLNRIRIQESKKSLEDKGKTIETVAEENGFLSSAVYIRNFKKEEGITPGEYRKVAKAD